MRVYSDQLRDVLTSSFNRRWVADLYYDGVRKVQDMPITEPSFSDDGSSLVQMTGSVTVAYQGDFAESFSPREVSDALAPAGAELAVYVVISAGSFMERVEMGWYRITSVPSAVDYTARYGGRRITIGSKVELELQDRFVRVQRDRFDVPGVPPRLASVFAEFARLTQLQLTRMVPDRGIPKAIAYEEERLEACYDLIEVLDAVPYMRPDGSAGQRPNEWPGAVDTLRDGNLGSIIEVGREMTSENVYNRVAFRTTSSDQTQILASAEITEGPLRARNANGSPSPAGRVTYYATNDLITTTAAAQAFVNQLLPRVSTMRATEVPLTEKFNPLRELGDVLVVSRADGIFTGRIKKIDRGAGSTQTLTLEVKP
jgi:hypothetical protein